MIRVVIADDHPIFREGLKQILDKSPDIQVIAEAADGEDVVAKVQSAPCDLVLLDLAMPGSDGLEVLRRIKTLRPQLPVVVLSMHSEAQFAERVLRAGAAGYLTKGGALTELRLAVRKVVAGGVYVSPALAEKLATDLVPGGKRPSAAQLSDREREVLLMLASGKNTTRIAGDLGLSAKTISTYRTRILAKLGLESNAGLIRYAIVEKLLE